MIKITNIYNGTSNAGKPATLIDFTHGSEVIKKKVLMPAFTSKHDNVKYVRPDTSGMTDDEAYEALMPYAEAWAYHIVALKEKGRRDWNKKTSEEKDAVRQASSLASRAAWKKKSPEEIERHREASRRNWFSMTTEEQQEMLRKQHEHSNLDVVKRAYQRNNK